MKRYLLCLLILLAVLAAVAARVPAADKGNPNPGVIPLDAKVRGLSYSQWGDRYNQWFWSIPRSVDLLANPGVGQDPASPVFFLPSASGSAAAEFPFTLEGPITVPAGKILLLPVTWVSGGTVPLDCCTMTREQVLACMPAILDSALLPESIGDLYASIDGHPIVNLAQYRLQSAEPFQVSLPADNVYSEVPSLLCGQIGAFTSEVNLSDGYWLMLAPLPPGQHTITFGCANILHTTLYVTVSAAQ